MVPPNFFFLYVSPLMGCILSYIIGATGIPKIREVDRTGVLGDMNPFPFIGLLFNSICWLTYGLMGIRDYWVFASNAPGFLMSCYCILVCHRHAPNGVKTRIELSLLFVGSLGLILVFFAGVVYPLDISHPESNVVRNNVLGFLADAALVIFYATPLAAVAKVIREKDASSIHWPLALASMINSVLWTVFGLAIKDYFIMAPNFFGVAFCSLQLFLILIYNTDKSRRSSKPQQVIVKNNVVLVMEKTESNGKLLGTTEQQAQSIYEFEVPLHHHYDSQYCNNSVKSEKLDTMYRTSSVGVINIGGCGEEGDEYQDMDSENYLNRFNDRSRSSHMRLNGHKNSSAMNLNRASQRFSKSRLACNTRVESQPPCYNDEETSAMYRNKVANLSMRRSHSNNVVQI